MSEHTPPPWRADAPRTCAGVAWDNIIRSERRNDPVCTVFVAGYMEREAAANAAFIVKAVNSHDALVTELKLIADWRNVSLASEYEHSLRDIIRSMLDCADRALASIKETV